MSFVKIARNKLQKWFNLDGTVNRAKGNVLYACRIMPLPRAMALNKAYYTT